MEGKERVGCFTAIAFVFLLLFGGLGYRMPLLGPLLSTIDNISWYRSLLERTTGFWADLIVGLFGGSGATTSEDVEMLRWPASHGGAICCSGVAAGAVLLGIEILMTSIHERTVDRREPFPHGFSIGR
jgi:hypothetical protein